MLGMKKYITKKIREKVVSVTIGEVELYDNYLTGMVYGYDIEPKDSNKLIECDDSCWGFYGSDFEKNGLLEYAKNAIDGAIEAYREKAKENHNRRRLMARFMSSCWAY